jgi:Fis family transcriptional regulator
MRCYLWRLDGHEVSDLHEMVLGEVERPLIETVLDHTDGNQSQAARMLGMSRSTLRKKMARYRVRQES